MNVINASLTTLATVRVAGFPNTSLELLPWLKGIEAPQEEPGIVVRELPFLSSKLELRAQKTNALNHFELAFTDVRRQVTVFKLVCSRGASQISPLEANPIKKALPLLAGLAIGAISKETGRATSAGDSSGGLLGGLAGGNNNQQGGREMKGSNLVN